MLGNKRDAAMAQHLLKKFGDIKLSDVKELSQAQNNTRPPGRPPMHGMHELYQIFWCVELRKRLGLRSYVKEAAKHLGLSDTRVQKLYAKGRRTDFSDFCGVKNPERAIVDLAKHIKHVRALQKIKRRQNPKI
jgi:hypothetical protein